MSANLNLKTIFEADTKDLTRGAQQAKRDIKDFGKTSDEVLSKMGDAIGVDTGKLDQMSNTARELGRRLSESGNAGVAALGNMLKSINAVQAGIAGLGIGAAISAFKLLNAEAENFRTTVEGARLDAGTAAYISTYTQVLHDLNAETGKNVAEFENGWKEAFGRFKANFSSNVVGTLTGKQHFGSLGAIAAASAFGNTPEETIASGRAEEAKKLAEEIYDIQREIARKSVEWKESEAQIAELRRKAKDDTEGIATRTSAISQAMDLAKQRYEEEAILLDQIATKTAKISELARDSVPAEDAMLAAKRTASEATIKMETALKSIDREQRSIRTEAEKQAAAYAEAAAYAAAFADQVKRAREEMTKGAIEKPESGQSSPGTSGSLVGKAETTMQVTALVRPELDKKAAEQTGLELAQIVSSVTSETSEVLGKLIGDLATGGDAWHNFANNAISAFGDLAITVGKMAIGVGMTTEAIKKALIELGGVGAIAAGAALVALGTAVKAGLANVAAGNFSTAATGDYSTMPAGGYNPYSYTAPSNYGAAAGNGGSYASSSLNVTISGKLTADGRDLSLVLSQENIRKKTVT